MEFSAVNTIWVLLGAAMVFFMQAGFAMVETGFTRAKNAGNIIMKNLMDFCIGAPLYWIVGFGIMFGGSGALFGAIDMFSTSTYAEILPAGVPKYAYLIFQTVFCATAATIVSGAMAERTKFSSYCLYSGAISLIIYPISGHWIWGGGWLAQLGFHDFAGSTAVHMLGGVLSVVGASILGPRLGKYDKNGNPRAIPGHSLTLGALGCFILWFCWFGFNGCSTVSMEGDAISLAGKVFVTTNLAAAVATFTVMIFTWIRYKKPDVSMTLNGSLAGLVAITAGCDTVTPAGSAIIGIIAGIVIVFAVEFFDKVAKIDDPVGAISVHGCCGALGTLMIGLFSDGSNTLAPGLFYGGGLKMLGIETLGVVSTIAWGAVTGIILFQIIKHTIGLRASKEEEIVGMDATEHGLASAYADFNFSGTDMTIYSSADKAEVGVVPPAASVPVKQIKTKEKITDENGSPISKVVIVTKQSKFEALKEAMAQIGVTGMTVTQVLGCGVQAGKTDYYRGVAREMNLLPKIKVEIVVSAVPVDAVVAAAKSSLYTGNIGDGKIFVYDVENVIKVRTGEEGYDALQGEDQW